MTDREKVIFGLKCLTNEDPYMSRISCKKKKCPYAETETDNCAPAIWRDALELLKGQEPVKPVFVGNDEWQCPECETAVGWKELDYIGIEETKYNYCPGCGREMNWDE